MWWFIFWFAFYSIYTAGGFAVFASVTGRYGVSSIAVSFSQCTTGAATLASFSSSVATITTVAAFFPIYAVAAVSTAFFSIYPFNSFLAAAFSLSDCTVAFICSAVIAVTFITPKRSYSAV